MKFMEAYVPGAEMIGLRYLIRVVKLGKTTNINERDHQVGVWWVVCKALDVNKSPKKFSW